MLGVLITVLVTVLCVLAGWTIIRRWSADLDPLERMGVAGMTGLGLFGLATLFVGLVPGGLNFGLWILLPLLAILAALAIAGGASADFKMGKPTGWMAGGAATFVIAALIGLFGVLAPSTPVDWDSLAYHLAVPKLWLNAGQIEFVRGIHHSNFPFTFDNLYIWGIKWGGEAGAKAFSWCAFLLGGMFIAGLARRWSGPVAAGVAMVLYASIPVMVWESGTAYIDGVHGIYAAIGIVFAVEAALAQVEKGLPRAAWLSAIGLGFCAGTKHTGLQVLAAVVFVLAAASMIRKQAGAGIKRAAVIGAVALAICAPWYIKSAVMTGNPVFPFFYGVLGGQDWDEWRSEIYTEEQKSFGIGSKPTDLGYAALGMAFQPGRYVNPQQHIGGGFPTGALGFAVLAGGLILALSGCAGTREKMLLSTAGMLVLMWFVLSQQSRYMAIMALPLIAAVAGAWPNLRLNRLVAGAAALQAACTFWMMYRFALSDQGLAQVAVVSGKISRVEYIHKFSPFSLAAESLNETGPSTKVALYDMVFGWYLDVPYFWANPGHSKMIPYETLTSGEEYAEAMRELGFTHVYVNLSDNDFTAALSGQSPYTTEQGVEMSKNLNEKWRFLVADAVRAGKLVPSQQVGGGLIFTLPH